MSKVISFEYNRSPFNVNYDLVWSLKFALTGDTLSTQGGFTTFLRLEGTTLSGGGDYKALGYLPGETGVYDNILLAEDSDEILTEDSLELLAEQSMFVASNTGIISALLAVGFDTNGFFALSTVNYDGISLPDVPSLTIRGGYPSYNLLYTTPLTSLTTEFTLLTTTVNYCWLRFRLGNIGSKIYIDYRYGDGSSYIPLTSIPVSLQFTDSTRTYVGVSYSTPLTATSVPESTFILKSFTVEGNTINQATSTTYTNLTSVGETILIAQSGGDIATQDEHIVLT